MSQITASMVKDLREKTGAGMMDCKKALQESDADIEKAIDWLRQKGLAKAAKRADRAAEEGIIVLKVAADNKKAVAVEVKCETDFVARGDKFISFAKDIVDHAFDNFVESPEEMLAQTFKGTTMKEALGEAVAAIGENILLGKAHKSECTEGIVGAYVHSNGKLAALVEVRTTGNEQAAIEFAKNIAMQVVATSPVALDAQSVDPALLEREREVYRNKAKEEGKPDNIIDKIADGAVKKYCKEICLMEQAYIKDDKMSVAEYQKQASKEAGAEFTVLGFTRIVLGE